MKVYEEFIRTHNLVNRLYDMSNYFNLNKNNKEKSKVIKRFFHYNLGNIEYVELLAKYFDEKKQKCKNNVELYCNLKELINDLNYLKQYILFDDE